MKYSIGSGLADFGFTFFEKLHEPVFLVHRLGKLTKLNEAGRKFLKVAKLSAGEVNDFCRDQLAVLKPSSNGVLRLRPAHKRFHLIVQMLQNSDYILVEVKR